MARITGEFIMEGAAGGAAGFVDSVIERADDRSLDRTTRSFGGWRDWYRLGLTGGGLLAHQFDVLPREVSGLGHAAFQAGATLLGRTAHQAMTEPPLPPPPARTGSRAQRQYSAAQQAEAVVRAMNARTADVPGLEIEEEIPTLG